MIRTVSVTATLFAVLLLLASSALSASLEEGFVAFKQGDKELAHKNWLPLAIQGNVRAQFLLSVLYERWTERSASRKNAKKWLTAAANNGFIPAQFNLGNNYLQGRYGKADNKMAAYWWEQAAVQGFVDAQYHLAMLYYQGDGIQRSPKEAVYWLKKAADSGYPEATAALVEMRAGRLVRTDKRGEVANISYDDPMIVSTQLAATPASAAQDEPTDTTTDSSIAGAMPKQAQQIPPAEKQATGLPEAEKQPAADRGWVAQQSAANYTIQLLASGRMSSCEEQVKQLYERYQLETHAHAFALKGRKLCSVIYGSYEKPAEAKAKLKQLPRNLRQNKPWIRKLSELQELAI